MFRLRKKVLLRDPELAALHRAVVIKGKLSETDFWSTRQVSVNPFRLRQRTNLTASF